MSITIEGLASLTQAQQELLIAYATASQAFSYNTPKEEQQKQERQMNTTYQQLMAMGIYPTYNAENNSYSYTRVTKKAGRRDQMHIYVIRDQSILSELADAGILYTPRVIQDHYTVDLAIGWQQEYTLPSGRVLVQAGTDLQWKE